MPEVASPQSPDGGVKVIRRQSVAQQQQQQLRAQLAQAHTRLDDLIAATDSAAMLQMLEEKLRLAEAAAAEAQERADLSDAARKVAEQKLVSVGSPLPEGLAGADSATLERELQRQRDFSSRMRDALLERDRRMLGLEKKAVEEAALRMRAEDERVDLLGKLRDAHERMATMQKQQTLSNALSLGGVISKDVLAKNPDALQREGLRQARHEVAKLEKEREDLAHINGRLLLRLNDMEGSITKLRKSLKVENAAEGLNRAYEAARAAQQMVGDTASLLVPEIAAGGFTSII